MFSLASGLSLSAQLMPNFGGILVPQYMPSGTSTRLPVVWKGRVDGLQPNTAYQYSVSLITSGERDTATTSFRGAGNRLFIDSNNWKYSTAYPNFNTGADCDTFYTGGGGEYIGWFCMTNTGNSRFTAGTALYPYIAVRNVNTGIITRYYCPDSITVLAWGSNPSQDTGTGIWGKSLAPGKSMVALYDNETGFGRPIAMTYAENENFTVPSTVGFYTTNVNGVSGRWGTIIPNVLANGIRRIENFAWLSGMSLYANTDADGIWGPSAKSTVNRSGGSTTPVALDENDAALVPPVVEFWARTSNADEGVATKEVYVVRKYSNSQGQSVRLTVSSGTATKGATNDYTLTEPKTINFAPGGQVNDTTKITIIDDNVAEGDETIILRLDNPSNCTIGTEISHTITIKDNDIANIVIGQKTVVAKETDGKIGITLKMDKPVNSPSSVRILVKKLGDSTYIPGEFSLGSSTRDSVISLGKVGATDSVTIFAKVFDDFIGDPHDTIVVVIRQLSGTAAISDSLITLVVLDNDGPAVVRFVGSEVVTSETAANVKIRIQVVSKTDAGGDYTLRYINSGSTATQGSDFTYSPSSQIFTIDENTPDTMVVTVPLLDDDIYEPTENILFSLGTLSNVRIMNPDSFNVVLLNNDLPMYNIGTINKQTKADGTPDSLNVKCRINGTVYGVNTRTSGLGFTVIDHTGGIAVFTPSKTFGYTVKEGDSVRIQGTVRHFQGTAQMDFVDTIIFLAGNKTLKAATVVTNINESTESNLVQIRRVKLVDASEWPTAALSNNGFKYVRVQYTDGTTDTLNIDAETNIDGTPAPVGYVNITGLGGQFDNSTPFKSSHVLSPRYLTDIVAASLPTVSFSKTTDNITELADSFRMDFVVAPLDENFSFDVAIKGGTAVSPTDYDFNTRTISVIKNNSVLPIRANISDDATSDGEKTLVFVIRNINGPGAIGADSTLTLTIADNEPSNVKGFAAGNIRMYPNPSAGKVFVNSTQKLSSVAVYALDGRCVWNSQQVNEQFEIGISAAGIYIVKATSISGDMFSEALIIR